MPSFVFIIAPGFSDNSYKLDLTISLTRITFPFLLFFSFRPIRALYGRGHL